MRKSALPVLLATSLLVASSTVCAGQDPQATAPPAQPAAQQPAAQPAKAGGASTPRSDAAEARYRDWVEKEHAKDAVEFAKEKSKIEDKYKGYVRPKREKKDGKAESAPAKP
ncbi:hypothetical protein DVDV_0471 [Desulfovibrio sp. DV]|uniref:hypothetical protein n=1 Tax=Desulfovibrio sp. DV TaxID=1844708 RepID=UPI00094B8F5F|nr:hypothetical protein [Desulfovibrio sp. DV]OLN30769.1 hypothetical protein DVDV_0471 [Desulfovibrio sp. DV]